MKILANSQIRELDKRTVEEEQISSWELMERAATALTEAICQMFPQPRSFKIFAGPGNNGGDALAVARMLSERGHKVDAYLFNTKGTLSEDCRLNAEKLLDCPEVNLVEVVSHFCPPQLYKTDVVIDGLFGSGLSRPLDGGFATVVRYINAAPATVFSIDVPSGLMCEDNSYNTRTNIICADMTLSLQMPKLAFFFAENQEYIGDWCCLDISLSSQGIREADTPYEVMTGETVRPMMHTREEFAHKGHFGRAMLVAGSYGMAGASVLAARACLRSGVGLLTLHVPQCNGTVVQTAVPEAMAEFDENELYFAGEVSVEGCQAVGVGPGLGRHEDTAGALYRLLQACSSPMVLDADALNILSEHKEWLTLLPPGSILTPHPKELERLVGRCSGGFERLERARRIARLHRVSIVLKGAWTVVVSPEGRCRFNPTGNPGMATAGSGDVLTGVLLALLAQGYAPDEAAVLGAYLHGVAGDLAAEKKGENGMIAGDIVDNLPLAWERLKKNQYLCAKEQKCY